MITDAGKELRIVTNDLDSPAQEIADLYKQRWDIELFFRWVKQTLKITRFIGVSENAVRTQIAVALIAFLICASRQLLKRPSAVRSSLLDWFRQISCTNAASTDCSAPTSRPRQIQIR